MTILGKYFKVIEKYILFTRFGLDFKINDLPSVLILVIVVLIINDSLCCSYAHNGYCL